MNEAPPLVRLDLRAPLLYTEAPELEPQTSPQGEVSPFDAFNCPPPGESGESAVEFCFCFELDGEQAQSIEPEPGNFLGRLVFSGKSVQDRNGEQGSLELPAGLYLFAQRRGLIGREECIALAIEQQKDGLWERIKLENRLYIRCLYEDGSQVTQIFRPCCKS